MDVKEASQNERSTIACPPVRVVELPSLAAIQHLPLFLSPSPLPSHPHYLCMLPRPSAQQLRSFSTRRPTNRNSTPSPLAFAALAALSLGAFVYITTQRDAEAKHLPASERRRQFENPLIPPRHKEEPVDLQTTK